MLRIPQTASPSQNAFRGAAYQSQVDRALLIHNATRPERAARICSECCGEAKIVEEVRQGVGRFRVRVCQKPACGWHDDYSRGLGLIAAEPAIPEGKGSFAHSATLAYVTARLAVLGGSAEIPVLLDPIGKARNFSRYMKHNINAHELAERGVLLRDARGVCRLPSQVVGSEAPHGSPVEVLHG